MPLPWKKPKVGRISRLVADLQQSPKRGGSLVVETGFPTSLIDLFVKNRDRLKKPSKRRHPAPSPSSTPPPPPLPATSPPPHPPATSCFSLPVPTQQREERESVDDNNEIPGVKEAIGANLEDRDVRVGARSRCGRPSLFMAVLKVFVVVVLALSTKKLAVGITLSAFALLFLECVAVRAFPFLKLCPNARIRLDSLTQRVFGKQKEKLIVIENTDSCEITEDFQEPKHYTEEIRVLESEFDAISCPEPELVNRNKNLDGLATDGKTSVIEGGETIRVLISKSERSRSSKLKSKIVKKIVPKKFRKKKSKKYKGEEQEESMSEATSFVSDDKSEKIEEENPEKDEDVIAYSPLRQNCREGEFHVGVDDSAKNMEVKTEGNKGCVIMLLIVLAGLLGGRVLAIGLTLVWCLALRIAGNLKRKSV